MGFWFTLLLWGAMTVLSDLLSPKPDIEDAKPSGLGDFQFPTATEGRALPLAWGTVPISGPNVVWYGNLVQTPITEKIKTGLFSSERVIRGYTYKVGMQFALCQGVVDELRQVDIGEDAVLKFTGIWSAVVANNGTGYSKGDILTISGGTSTVPARVRVTKTLFGLVREIELIEMGTYTAFPSSPANVTGGSGSGCTLTIRSGPVTHGLTVPLDRPTLLGGNDLGNGGISGTLEFFSGTSTQNVSTYLSSWQKIPASTGDTPAYRDVCYLAPFAAPIYVGNSTSIRPWRFTIRRTPNNLSLTSNRHIVNGGDANPANVIYEALTNDEWGYGIATGDIDSASFVTAGNTLHSEGNGFSFLLDNQEDIGDLVRRIEQQIDGIVFFDPTSNKWKLRLVRFDYDIETVPELTVDDNVIEISSFTRGTWEGTKNQVRVPFVDREDDFKESFGFAQDMANRITLGKTMSTTVVHPGVKYGPLANALAWRELRTLAFPLASGEIVVDRTLYGVLPGDVLALTNERLGLVKLPVRVRAANYGELLDGRITLQVVQDVFNSAAGSFGNPPNTGWERPGDNLDPFPNDEQLAFEAPRAFTLRDTVSPSATSDRVYAAGRRQGDEVTFRIVERHAAGTPTGGFAEIGNVYGFMLAGELNASLAIGSAYPLSTLVVTPTPDAQATILAAFNEATFDDVAELGTDLITLCLVDEEFFLVTSAQTSGANIQLNDVYRGVLDSVQAAHASGASVYLLFVGGGLSDSTIEAGQNVHVKLLPRSASDTVEEDEATQIAFAMSNRVRRPYAPAEASLNGTRFDTTVSLEGGAGTGEAEGIDVELVRRDFRTTNEIAALLDDAADLDPSYPSANTTTHEIEVIKDPAGTPVTLFTHALGATATGTVTRIDILLNNAGALPTTLRFAIRSTHTFEGTSYDSRYDLNLDFSLSSALTGQFAFGALDTNVASAAFTVTDGATDHDFAISSAFTAGDVEYRINGGSWTTLIAAAATTGTIGSGLISNGDTIEVRHLSSDVGAKKLLTMTVGTPAGFGVLYV
jgi:hypothetical protein